jgi:hypothetical protein
MSNDYIQYQAARYQQAELIRAAEQYRLAKEAARAENTGARDGGARDGGAGEGGARRAHHRGVRLFGRSIRPSARPTAC